MGTCYSSPAALPLPLNITNCSLGFYCPNLQWNDSLTFPQVCPPSVDCSIARLGSRYCQPQGVFEPQLCSPGFYCPDQFTKLPCPAGTYCIRGSSAPLDCPPMSSCPPQTELRVFYGGLVITLLLDLLMLALFLWGRLRLEPARTKRARAAIRARYGRRGGGGDGAAPPPSPVAGGGGGGYTALELDGDEPGAPPPPTPRCAKSELNTAFARCNAGMKLRLQFSQLGLTLPPPLRRTILRGVSGEIHPGRVTAVMGPSGAGKTTFLSVLMGKVRRTNGTLRVNGVPDEMHRYRQIIGFVPQEDTMLRELTVRENILFSARMRLPREGWSDAEIQAHVDAVIEVLGLSECAHTLIGDETSRGVSGGQRKRCNIGMELAVAPAALFLDEPTSGLDSAAALEVCRTLRAVADLGLTIVAVIHQPRAEIFRSIDDLLLLAPGGVTAFLGPCEQALPYFGQLGFEFAPGSNPADELLDLVAGNAAGGIAKLAASPSGQHLAALPAAASPDASSSTSGGDDASGTVAKPGGAAAGAAADSLSAVSAYFESQWRLHCAARSGGDAAGVDAVAPLGAAPAAGDDDEDDDDDGGYDALQMDKSHPLHQSGLHGGALLGGGRGGGVHRVRLGPLLLPASLSSWRGLQRAAWRAVRQGTALLQRTLALVAPQSSSLDAALPVDGADELAADELPGELSFGRGAPFLTQLRLCTFRSLLQQYRNAATYALELGVCLVAGGVMGGAAAQLPELYNGVLKPPYTLISPAPLETIVPSVGLYVALAIGLAGSPAGVLVFAEEKPVFWREAAAGHSRLAYYLAKSVSVIPRLTVGALHFTSIFHWWASPATSFSMMFGIVWLEFFCVYGAWLSMQRALRRG